MERRMKKTIAGAEYDTESAELIYKFTEGALGDSFGYEEILYKTEEGRYFLYMNGGAKSPYPKENIKRMSPARADEWLSSKHK